jgi:hypothetical protein
MRVLVSGIIGIFLLGGVVSAQYETTAPAPPPAAPTSPTPASQARANVRAEVNTAATHAGFASEGGNLGYVRLHLRHALNCLEGPRGANFNKSWGNVCEGQGNGILTDLKSTPNGSTMIVLARQADAIALKGIRTAKLADAKASARQVASLLRQIARKLK